jgi:phosphatidylinositol kinase/protein kinase (PI-3  family)
MQVIQLMDRCLKHHGLDCCLSPYNVIATSSDTGFVELVPNSTTLSSIRDIRVFLKQKAEEQKMELCKLLNNFVKSLAGYCVITFICMKFISLFSDLRKSNVLKNLV